MNRIFKSIFNRRTGTWQVVSEKASNTGTSGNSVSQPLLAMLLGLSAATGLAQTTNTWTGTADSNWANTANWSDGVPSNTNIAEIMTAGSPNQPVIGNNAAATAQRLYLDSGNSLTVGNGGTLKVSEFISVSRSAVNAPGGTLNVLAGGQVTADAIFIGDGTNTGKVVVSGTGSSLTINLSNVTPANRFAVGANGDGELTVADGASISVGGTGLLELGAIFSQAGTGTLKIGTGGLAGTVSATFIKFGTATSSIIADFSDVMTLDSIISGSGSLVKRGVGTLILTGDNTYTGITNIDAGTLQIGDGGTTGALAGDIFIATGAALAFNRSNNFTSTSALSGNGIFNKLGTGSLTYTGDGSGFSGTTNINAGTLAVNGSLAGSTNVNSGGTLGGTGTVGNVTVASGGTLNPGNSIGTLTVNGNLTFASGSTYQVEADAAGNSDKVIVNGTATLGGNVVALPASGGSYQTNTAYTILSSTNALNGQFNSSVSSSLAFLNATLTQDTNKVYLHLKRNDISYSDVAQTPNQRSVANALQNAGSSGANSTDMNTVITAVNNLSANNARAAFESISGTGLVNLRRASTGFTGNFGNQLMGRLQSSGMSSTAQSINGMQLAANDRLGDLMPALAQDTRSDAPASGKFSLAGGIPMDAGKRGFWLRGFGFDQDTDSDGNAAGSRIKGVGITAGFDARVSNDLVIGAALSHATSDVRASFSETGKSRGNAAAVYASYASGPWNVNGNLMLAHNANNMNRNITVGAISRTANARFDSKTVSAYGEVSYDLPQASWTLQPLAGLGVTHNRNDGFTETGAGALNIQANAQNTTSTKTLFGARALFDLNGIQVQPRAMWAHEFGDLNKAMTAQLQGSPAASFATYGVDLPRDSFITGVTVAGRTNDGLSLFADVQGEFNRKQTGVALLIGLRKSW